MDQPPISPFLKLKSYTEGFATARYPESLQFNIVIVEGKKLFLREIPI